MAKSYTVALRFEVEVDVQANSPEGAIDQAIDEHMRRAERDEEYFERKFCEPFECSVTDDDGELVMEWSI